MGSLLSDEGSWRVQMLVWGWAVTDKSSDPRRALRDQRVALLGEARPGRDGFHDGWWDRDVAWCRSCLRSDSSGSTYAPEWMALPALGEWLRRGAA